MDTRDWHILWGVPPKYDNENNGALDDNATLAANVFYASTLNVILADNPLLAVVGKGQ